ncbi:MAG TPA: hypothetical protein VLD59_02630 [Steroidobacteraceae bacterium]|nr:hypothetical protein [Steroidobacteraceae bacterium]
MLFIEVHFVAAASEEMAVFPALNAPGEDARDVAGVRDDDHSVMRARQRMR